MKSPCLLYRVSLLTRGLAAAMASIVVSLLLATNAHAQADITDSDLPHSADSYFPEYYDYRPLHASDNMIDLDHCWHSADARQGCYFPHWIEIDFGSPRTVTQLNFLAYWENYLRLKEFWFEGSNDAIDYTPLHGAVCVYDNTHEWQTFMFNNTSSYRFYRLRGLNNWAPEGSLDASQMIIEEWEMLEVPIPMEPSPAFSVFRVEPVAEGLPIGSLSAMSIEVAPASFGAYGGHIFIADRAEDRVLRVDPLTGIVSVFALTPIDPVCLRFGPGGVFGEDLYVSCNQDTLDQGIGGILKVDALGQVSVFGSQTPPDYLYGGAGLAFSLAGSYGTYLYTGTSSGSSGDAISQVPPEGSPTSLFHNVEGSGGYEGTPGDLVFGNWGGSSAQKLVFSLLSSDDSQQPPEGIYTLDPEGNRTPLVTRHSSLLMDNPWDTEFGQGGRFGTDLYVSVKGAIVRVDSSGRVIPVVQGIANYRGEGLAFDSDRFLYFLSSGTLYRLVPDPITDTPAVPLALQLDQNHPNPFNPSTCIRYNLPKDSYVKLDIYNTSGGLVVSLVGEEQGEGSHSVVWNGKDERGNSAASGIYFYRLTAGMETISKKMVLLK